MCVRGEQKEEYSSVDYLAADLDELKRILKHNGASFCVRDNGASAVFIIQLDFSCCPDPLIRICMTPHGHVVYHRQLLLQTPVHLLLFSIFVVQADYRESAKAQSSKSNNQNTQKPVLFCVWVFAHLTQGNVCTCVIRATLHLSFAFFLLYIASVFHCHKKGYHKCGFQGSRWVNSPRNTPVQSKLCCCYLLQPIRSVKHEENPNCDTSTQGVI